MWDDETSPTPSGVTGRARCQLVGLLAGYLLASPRFHRPGVDGQTAKDVVAAEYPAAAAAGWVPRPAELAARHPDLADAILAYFPARVAPAGMTF